MKTLWTAAAALLATTAMAATAQAETDFGGVTVDGKIELSYAIDGPFPGFGVIGSGDIVVPLGGAFGFSLGLDGATDLGGALIGYYPAVYYDTSFGRFSAGIPRSVIDHGYLPENPYGSASTVGWAFGLQTKSVVNQVFVLGGSVPLGLRWDGAFGNTEVGLSYHRIPNPGPAIHDFAIAGRHPLGGFSSFPDVTVSGGFEYATDGAASLGRAHFGAEASFDRMAGGLRYTYGFGTGGVDHAVTLFGDYAVTDKFTVDGGLTHWSGPGSATFLSAGARYDVFQNAYVDANVTTELSGGLSPVYELTVGWTF